VEGTLHVNGVDALERNRLLMTKCGYVEQYELFIGTMTVKEHLIFQAMLRLKASISDSDRRARVEEVLWTMDLEKCQNTIIGVPGKLKGISGGELKRLTFASVILNDPKLLIVDEPTSGLDSHLAKSVVNIMKKLTDEGKTMITVIHQPTLEIYSSLDMISLLVNGKQAYFGDRTDTMEFFASSLQRPCPPNYNPAEYYLTQLSSNTNNGFVGKCIETFQHSSYNKSMIETIHHINKISTQKSATDEEPVELDFESGFPRQMKWLLWRAFKAGSRNPVQTTDLLLKLLFPALTISIIYFQSATMDTPQTVQNSNAIVQVVLMSICTSNSFVVLATLPNVMHVFIRERKRYLYNTPAFYISKLIADFPFFMTMPILFITIVYWSVGFAATFKLYFLFCFVGVLATLASVAFNHIFAAIMPSVDSAVSIALPFIETAMLFTGFMINNRSVPVYFKWFQYSTWYYYSYSAILLGIWKPVHNMTFCHSTDYCFQTGGQVLDFYAIPDKLGFDVTMLVVLIAAYHVATYILILIRLKRS
ncbi:unnamed protein product, partial [Didymodactylos carnosus]